MPTPPRTRTNTINIIATALSSLEHVGIAVEPIKSHQDPDNKTHGDYFARVFFQRAVPERRDSFTASVFEITLPLIEFQEMSDEKLVANLEGILASAKRHQGMPLERCAGVHTRENKIVSVADFLASLPSADR